MQTFLPYADYSASAKTLDRQRLGKQRVEVLQLLNALTNPAAGWKNHPATKMWRGHEGALIAYGIAVCDEWISRGYKDTCRAKIAAFARPDANETPPSWLGNRAFHSSHKANLLRKSPEWYGQFGWSENPETPYVWPVP